MVEAKRVLSIRFPFHGRDRVVPSLAKLIPETVVDHTPI